MAYPSGFYSFGTNIGIKDKTRDFTVIYSETPCVASAVFTKNNFPGAPIIVGRKHIAGGILQAIVVNSKNSNVATGEKGIQDSEEICSEVAKSLGIPKTYVLPSSTGVIGIPLPMDKLLPACRNVKSWLKPGNLEEAAEAILTTDKKKKIAIREMKSSQGSAILYGIAKGAGMIEPNMATMLSYILCDAVPEDENLYEKLKKSVDQSFNCISIDSDTSTSDTVALLCSRVKGRVPTQVFQEALDWVCMDLAKQIVMDGEGATKLIELQIDQASSIEQADKIGKSVINSPLVKTAIYGADPNWGRFVMAIGKVFSEPIPYETLEIFIGEIPVKNANEETRKKLGEFLKNNNTIPIVIRLHCGNIFKTYWGCDLTEEYIKENAYYTT